MTDGKAAAHVPGSVTSAWAGLMSEDPIERIKSAEKLLAWYRPRLEAKSDLLVDSGMYDSEDLDEDGRPVGAFKAVLQALSEGYASILEDKLELPKDRSQHEGFLTKRFRLRFQDVMRTQWKHLPQTGSSAMELAAVQPAPTQLESSEADAMRKTELERKQQILAQIVGEMTPRELIAVTLRVFGNLTTREIGEKLGVSSNMVSRILRKWLGEGYDERLEEVRSDKDVARDGKQLKAERREIAAKYFPFLGKIPD